MVLFTSSGLAAPASVSILASDFFQTLVISSAVLLPTKSPVASAVFQIAFLEAVFIVSVVDFLALLRILAIFFA